MNTENPNPHRFRSTLFTTLLLSFAFNSGHADPLVLVNGDFETGAVGDSSLLPITGWTDTNLTEAGFWLAEDQDPGSTRDPSEAQGGSSLFLSANRLAGGRRRPTCQFDTEPDRRD